MFVIAPWNYPYLTAVNSIIPALMAGNAVILKHSAQTPLCAERFAEVFAEAGLPDDVFQYLHLGHRAALDLIAQDGVDFVAFTGSVGAGQAVQEAAAKRFIGVGLELGGKDPAYVRADVNIAHAVENLVDGAFFNAGQSCCGLERIYVHEAVYDEVLDGMVDLTKQFRNSATRSKRSTTLGPSGARIGRRLRARPGRRGGRRRRQGADRPHRLRGRRARLALSWRPRS